MIIEFLVEASSPELTFILCHEEVIESAHDFLHHLFWVHSNHIFIEETATVKLYQLIYLLGLLNLVNPTRTLSLQEAKDLVNATFGTLFVMMVVLKLFVVIVRMYHALSVRNLLDSRLKLYGGDDAAEYLIKFEFLG
jgi:fumarate reductase subunit D